MTSFGIAPVASALFVYLPSSVISLIISIISGNLMRCDSSSSSIYITARSLQKG